MNFVSLILPLTVVFIVIFGFVKKINVFDCFVNGAKQGIETVISLLPVLTGLVVAISMFTSSGAVNLCTKLLSPLFSFVGIPEEVIPLCILSPVSGSGSLTVFESIINTYGPDSVAGRVASVIAGSTETTFYAVAVYLGSVGIKKSGTVIPCALLGDIVSFISASLAVKYFFI